MPHATPPPALAALARGYTGDFDGATAALAALPVHDPSVALCRGLLGLATGDFDAARVQVRAVGPTGDPDLEHVRVAARTLVDVQCDGRIVVPVDEVAVPETSPWANLVAFLVTEAAFTVGLVERGELASRAALERETPDDPFRVWTQLTRARILAFFGQADAVEHEVRAWRDALAGWPLETALLGSLDALVAGLRGEEAQVDRCTDEVLASTTDLDALSAMSIALCGLAQTSVGHAARSLQVVALLGDELAHLPVTSRAHVGDQIIESALRTGDLTLARQRLARSELLGFESGSFAAAAVERSIARVRAAEVEGAPDAGPHAEMYLTRDRAMADVAALPREPADVQELTRLVAGSGLARVRSWAGFEPGTEESSQHLFAGLGWDSLSPQQRVVARLAAAGLRNREIGAQLYLSEKTVESHVATILATLGASRRSTIGRRVPGVAGADSPALGRVTLSPRQAEVARLIEEGLGNREIARHMGVSEGTVEKHVARLFELLGVHSRAAVAAHVRRS